jgi:hypothetical protein
MANLDEKIIGTAVYQVGNGEDYVTVPITNDQRNNPEAILQNLRKQAVRQSFFSSDEVAQAITKESFFSSDKTDRSEAIQHSQKYPKPLVSPESAEISAPIAEKDLSVGLVQKY